VADVLKSNEERDTFKAMKSTEQRNSWVIKSSQEQMRIADPYE